MRDGSKPGLEGAVSDAERGTNSPTGTEAPRLVISPFPADAGELAAGEVRVWVVRLDAPPVPAAELFECLTPDERQRAERYKVEKARHEFVTGRGLLRRILGRRLGLDAQAVPLTYTGAGKPVLAAGEVHFNVTHTAGLALIALAERPVGIDVERVRLVENPDGLVERFFSAAECEAFRGLPTDLRFAGFFRGWTCKEAVIKAAALSVSCLGDFDVELHPRRAAALLGARHAVLREGAWGLAAWEPAPGYAAAVAVAEDRG
jgi:4'-phosphopantetheinyl transferase